MKETQPDQLEDRQESDIPTDYSEQEQCFQHYPGLLADIEDELNEDLDDVFERDFFRKC